MTWQELNDTVYTEYEKTWSPDNDYATDVFSYDIIVAHRQGNPAGGFPIDNVVIDHENQKVVLQG
jgi:hypothetical protein